MTAVENGADPAANDTALANPNPAPIADETDDTAVDLTEGAEEGEGEEGQSREPEWAEIELDGKKYRVEAAVKDGYLRQADYTQKTQTVAQEKKALQEERAAFAKTSDEIVEAKAQVFTLNKSVQQYDDYFKTPDWANLKVQDPGLAQQHYLQYSEMKTQLDGAKNTVTQKEQERTESANRERGERANQAFSELPKLIKDWSPELGTKLDTYATAEGLSPKEVLEATIANPKFVKLLNKARLYDEGQKAKQIKQTLEIQETVKPVTRVGGNGGSAQQRKTTDSSGDALSGDEWVKRERERLAKRKA